MNEALIRASIDSLNASRDSLDLWLYFASFLVVLGVVFELIVIFHEYNDEMVAWKRATVQPPDRPSRPWLVADMIGVAIVCIGLAGELFVAVKDGTIDSKLRIANGTLVSLVNGRAEDAGLDAACARQETAQLQKESERLKKDAATAQLELARITGRPFLITVKNGIARPNLSVSDKQIVILTADTLIVLPTLPAGKHFDWTLSVIQNEVGGHRFRFSPDLRQIDQGVDVSPKTGWLVNFQTDSTGTKSIGWGGVRIDAPATSK